MELDKQNDAKTKQKLKRYIIDAKWWRKWCDYVNFDSTNVISTSYDNILNQIDSMNGAKRNSQLQRGYDSSTLYSKPERVYNTDLIDQDQKSSQQNLRENLIEHFDFEALSPNIWMHLYSWYSADLQIARYLKKDKMNTNCYILNLYPNQQNDHSYLGYQSSDSEILNDSSSFEESPSLRNEGNIKPFTQILKELKEDKQKGDIEKNSLNKFYKNFGISIPGKNKLLSKSQNYIEIESQIQK